MLSINCKSNATIIKWQQFRSDQYKDINSDNQKYFIQLDHDRNVSTLVINNLNLNDLVFYKCFDVNGYFSEFNLKEKSWFYTILSAFVKVYFSFLFIKDKWAFFSADLGFLFWLTFSLNFF